MAILSNNIEALDGVLEACGFRGEREGSRPRAARIVLFYATSYGTHLLAELRRAGEPLTARQLAFLVCQTEEKDGRNRRLLADVTRRVGCALRRMRASRLVEGERTQVWRLPIG